MTSNLLFVGATVFFSVLLLLVFDIIADTYKAKKLEDKIKNGLEEKNKDKKVQPKKPVVPATSYNELMEILNRTIKQELYFTTKLKFDFQDVKIIDFNSNLETISTRVMQSLSDSYLNDLSYYHKNEWIMEYVVKTVRIYLTDYIRNHPVV